MKIVPKKTHPLRPIGRMEIVPLGTNFHFVPSIFIFNNRLLACSSMIRILTIPLLLFSLFIFGQDPSSLLSEANSLYEQKEFEKSGIAYEKALSITTGSASDYYNAACSWALAGNTEKGLSFLNLAAVNGWSNLDHVKRDSYLYSLHGENEWTDILEKIQSNKDLIEKDYNKPLQQQLEQIYVKDQMLRQLYREAEDKFGRDSPEMNYFWELISKQDKQNEADVEKIINEFGWVGKSEVGGKANMTLWLVIQHAPLEKQELYLPRLQASVKAGESSGSHLALLEDRILMRNDKPQIYGSQVITNPETGNQEVYDLFEPDFVDERRASVGLAPLRDYPTRFGITWDIEQKEK